MPANKQNVVLATVLFFVFLFNHMQQAKADPNIVVDKQYVDYLDNRLVVINIFTRKLTKWESGENITVFTKPLGSIENDDFVFTWLGMTPGTFKRRLASRTYSGSSTGVIQVVSDEEMLFKVANTPASIGYLNYGIIVRHDKNISFISPDNID